MLRRDELEALYAIFVSTVSEDQVQLKMAQARATLAFGWRAAAHQKLDEVPVVKELVDAIGEFSKRLVFDKEADVGVVMSKVLGEVTGVVRRAAEQLAPLLEPSGVVAKRSDHGVTLQIFVNDVHMRTESFAAPTVIKIGKLDSSTLKLDDPKVNRMHAVMELSAAGELSIIDLGSTTGTLVNGIRVAKAELKDGYVVKLGDTALGISLR